MKAIVLTLVLLWIGLPVTAHEVRPAFLKLTELESDNDAHLFEASFRQPQLDGRYLGLELRTNCQSTPLSTSLTDGALIELFELDCGTAQLDSIEIVGLERTLIDTLVSVHWANGNTADLLINGNDPQLNLTGATPGLPVYLVIGLEHLLLGFDHVLFVIMLLYLVRKPWDLLKVVTGFTLAHSITLGLSAFNIVTLASAPVEAVIAGSIVLLAYENLGNKPSLTREYPILIAFAFGLLHGLGFAGALAEIGLPESSQLLALFLFNAGIELGQLAIIATVLTILILLRQQHFRVLYQVPIFLTGGIASFWYMERSWQIVLPLLT